MVMNFHMQYFPSPPPTALGPLALPQAGEDEGSRAGGQANCMWYFFTFAFLAPTHVGERVG
jgi:hypothetical protein